MKRALTPRVLFILKLRQNYGTYSQALSSGLFNSATFVKDMLEQEGIETKLVQVVDSNSIDKEVYEYRPTHVIVEALWVPPAKFDELKQLHPRVKFVVRVHSEIPFLAQEGMAVEWIKKYGRNVKLAFNSPTIFKAVKALGGHKVVYLPNYFPVVHHASCSRQNWVLDVGCFGALRGMKNQLIQAFAAMEYADKHDRLLRFHINVAFHGGTDGNAVLKNLRSLFHNSRHELVEHDWLSHDEFIKLLSRMDVSMQVSFSETFNIVTAHAVNLRIPVVASPAIDWVAGVVQADPISVDSIVNTMKTALDQKYSWSIGWFNLLRLKHRSQQAKQIWLRFLVK